MVFSIRLLLDALSRMPFNKSVELALILGEPHETVHQALAALTAEGIGGRVNFDTTNCHRARDTI